MNLFKKESVMYEISVGKWRNGVVARSYSCGYYYLTLSTHGKPHMHILLCTRNVYDISKRTE